MVRPADLPDFDKPPVDEVVIGLAFDPLSGYSDVHSGLYWQRVRDDYPRTQSHPRIDRPLEDLSRAGSTPPPPPFLISMEPKDGRSGRTWLIAPDDDYLLQVQDTQFLHNWRHREGEYPHFDLLFDRFWAGFSAFREMLESEGFAAPSLRQLEVSYFNWVPDLAPASFFGPARAARPTSPLLENSPDQVMFLGRFLDTSAEGDPVASLGVECQPAFRTDARGSGEHGSRLVLSYKAPLSGDIDASVVAQFAHRAREVIVRTFTDLTTPEAHEHWGRTK